MTIMSDRLRAIFDLRAKLAWHYRGTVLGVALTVLGLLSLKLAVPVLVNCAAAVFGAGLSILEILRLRGEARATIFQFRENDDFSDLIDDARDEIQVIKTGRETGWLYGAESRCLRRESVPTTFNERFRLAPELERWANAFLSRRFQESRMFNAEAVGLASDPPRAASDQLVRLRACSYYDFVTTNLLAQNDIYETGHHGLVKQGSQWFEDRSGRLRSMTDSWLANLVGVSTLAFTSDGKLVLVQQSKKNTGSPGLFAPSGSGALEPQDVEGNSDLASVIMAGANRELQEECGVAQQDLGLSMVTGYGRWLSRGAMPEFSGVTLLSVSSHELDARSIEKKERTYVSDRHFVRLSEIDSWRPQRPLDLLPREFRSSCSLPLALALSAMVYAVQEDCLPVIVELRQRASV